MGPTNDEIVEYLECRIAELEAEGGNEEEIMELEVRLYKASKKSDENMAKWIFEEIY